VTEFHSLPGPCVQSTQLSCLTIPHPQPQNTAFNDMKINATCWSPFSPLWVVAGLNMTFRRHDRNGFYLTGIWRNARHRNLNRARRPVQCSSGVVYCSLGHSSPTQINPLTIGQTASYSGICLAFFPGFTTCDNCECLGLDHIL
jgi:hypothetical protein